MPSNHSLFLSPKASAPLASSTGKKKPVHKTNALKPTGAVHSPVQLTSQQTVHVREMLLPSASSKGKGAATRGEEVSGFGRRVIDEDQEDAQADKVSHNSFAEMGNEYHQSVEQPSFLTQSDEEGVANQRDEVKEHPCAGAPLNTTTPTSEDIIDTLLDEEIHEVRLFLMNKQKGDVMRRILKPVAKGRVNKWNVDSFRVLIAYSKSVEDFEVVGGVIQLDFFDQTNPLRAVGEKGMEMGSDSVDSNSQPGAREVDGNVLEQAKPPVGVRWARVLVILIMAMIAGGVLAFRFAFDDDTALGATFWILRQFIAVDRLISALVESAKGLDFHSIVAARYTAGRLFVRYAYSSIVGYTFSLVQAFLESILSQLEDLRDHPVEAQGAPHYD